MPQNTLPPRARELGYGQLARKFGSHLPDNITLQVWMVGAVLGDIVIALCMTYYVGFLLLTLERNSNLIPSSLWQLSRYYSTIKRTKVILERIIRLTIETRSLTGT